MGDKVRAIAALGGVMGVLGGGAMAGTSSTGEREKRIAEALQLAVDKLVASLVTARERGDIEPQ